MSSVSELSLLRDVVIAEEVERRVLACGGFTVGRLPRIDLAAAEKLHVGTISAATGKLLDAESSGRYLALQEHRQQ